MSRCGRKHGLSLVMAAIVVSSFGGARGWAACVDDGDCDDSNPCTDDACVLEVCDYTNNADACDDGLFCTATDTCSGGTCVGSGDACPGEMCDDDLDACVDCLVNGDCDDDWPCTTDTCVEGDCQYMYNSLVCDDGAFCTLGDICFAGMCVGRFDACPDQMCDEENDACVECLADGDCDDGDPCTTDACVDGGCQYPFNTEPCDDGLFCTAADACLEGTCVGAGDACPGQYCDETNDVCFDCLVDGECEDDNPCTDDACVGGTCQNPGNTDACDDDLFCTLTDACSGGTCVGSGDPCPGELCDEVADICVECLVVGDCDDGNPCTSDSCVDGICQNPNNTDPCDDADACTENDTCSDGACAGTAVDCSWLDDQCSVGTCLPGTGACEAAPANEGEDCDDGLFCTPTDTCAGGVCVGWGDPCPGQMCDEINDTCVECFVGTDCDDDDPCTYDVCPGGTCQYAYNTEPCDDGDLCTEMDTCDGGVCAGTAVDCSGYDDQCNVGVCVPGTGLCQAGPTNEGSDCDDGNLCTEFDACHSGVCVGSVIDCSAYEDQCNAGTCEPATGLCGAVPANEGDPCDDDELCTELDTCGGGVCAGMLIDCSSYEDQCNAGICDTDTGLCEAMPANEGGSCDELEPCLENGTCSGGVCVGSQVDCSSYGDQCNVGICNVGTGLCEAVPANEGEVCDDGDQCTLDELCTSGSCVGLPTDCSSLDSACLAGWCAPTTGLCEAIPANDGGPCSDGELCTHNDECLDGVCAGLPIDCSALDEGCNVGVCNPASGDCEPVEVGDGEPCNDNLICTHSDVCFDSVCSGTPVDCSASDGECVAGVCNPVSGLCDVEPAHEGESCDDELPCTIDDVCVSGVCAGTVVGDTPISLSWLPASQTAAVGATVSVGLVMTSDTCVPIPVALIDAILNWDAGALVLEGQADPGPEPGGWADSGFPDDSGLDGLNAPFTGLPDNDGDALYQAFADFVTGVDAAADGTVVTVLQFRADAATPTALVSLIPSAGSYTYTRVLGAGDYAAVDITGSLPAPATVEIFECDEDAHCDDGNPCTEETCVDHSCVYTYNTDGCDDGLFCTMSDVCSDGACVGNGDSCPGQLCDEANDACVECLVIGDCDDDNVCTYDACAQAECVYMDNTNPCDDGAFCTSGDMCYEGACVPGEDACPGEMCDEDNDECVECLSGADCDDGNVCTDEICNLGLCMSSDNTAPCEDGLYCTAGDVCADGICQGGGDACPGQMCDEEIDACVECLGDAHCDDGNECTTDVCSVGVCTYTDAVGFCDDGAFCTATDSCVDGVCVGSGDTCLGQVCDEVTDQCIECEYDWECDDEVGCTIDACWGSACVHTPEHGGCSDGLFCTGQEYCDPVADCVYPGNPCSTPALCDEETDTCGCDAPTVAARGARAIEVTPATSPVPVALVVSSSAPGLSCLPLYVDVDGSLAPAPIFQTTEAWGTVYVKGIYIEPEVTYEVHSDCRDLPTDPVNLSLSVWATTGRLGDFDDSGETDLTDIVVVLDAFEGDYGPYGLHGIDSAPCATDSTIDLADIVFVFNAFAHDPFACPDPCP